MSVFTEKELEYLGEQRLGRLATVDAAGNPHVVPMGFRYDRESDTIVMGGFDIAGSIKWKHAERHPRVAFVVDDLAAIDPWTPRGIEIRGMAEILEEGGKAIMPMFADAMFRITPRRIVSWGVDKDMTFRPRSVT